MNHFKSALEVLVKYLLERDPRIFGVRKKSLEKYAIRRKEE